MSILEFILADYIGAELASVLCSVEIGQRRTITSMLVELTLRCNSVLELAAEVSSLGLSSEYAKGLYEERTKLEEKINQLVPIDINFDNLLRAEPEGVKPATALSMHANVFVGSEITLGLNRSPLEILGLSKRNNFIDSTNARAISMEPADKALVHNELNSMDGSESYRKRHFSEPTEQSETLLPMFFYKDKLLEMLDSHRCMILVGETGSGKSTQVPQYIYHHTQGAARIGITQPRRVAAISLANRVSNELQAESAGPFDPRKVSYCVRFEDTVTPATRITYLTDGMLVRQYSIDQMLSNYDILILDEVHERSVSTDISLGIAKILLQKRSDLRVIITSATLNACRFSEFFDNAPIMNVPGRVFPVDITYLERRSTDYISEGIRRATLIHTSTELNGDILFFLPGVAEMEEAAACALSAKRLDRVYDNLTILMVHAQQALEEQLRLFANPSENERRLILSTNIAETSLTIDRIVYVIDSGLVKTNVFDSSKSIDILVTVPTSKSSASQRAGRAGRVRPGICYRLYTEGDFSRDFPAVSKPEICRSNLASVLLLLFKAGFTDVARFPFVDEPDKQLVSLAVDTLWQLRLIDAHGILTADGDFSSRFPLTPELACVLLAGVKTDSLERCVDMISVLSADSIFARVPKASIPNAHNIHSRYKKGESDSLTALNAFYEIDKQNERSRMDYCTTNCLKYSVYNNISDIRRQLRRQVLRAGLKFGKCVVDDEKLAFCLAHGYFLNIAARFEKKKFKSLRFGMEAMLHPSSLINPYLCDYVLYINMRITTNTYICNCSKMKPEWLLQLAPEIFSRGTAS